MLWAACCTAFFGFLRVGEMTIPTQHAYNDSIHLSLEDVALDNRLTPTVVWLTIKQSKTDPFHKGAQLCLGLIGSVVCPVKGRHFRCIYTTAGPLKDFSISRLHKNPHTGPHKTLQATSVHSWISTGVTCSSIGAICTFQLAYISNIVAV